MRFQDAIEAKAFALAGEDFSAPAQRVDDFLAGRPSETLPKTSYILGVRPVDLREVLPDFIIEGMKAAILHFDRQILASLHRRGHHCPRDAYYCAASLQGRAHDLHHRG